MKRALFYIIFLALSMAVIAAPTKKPRAKCTPTLLAAAKARGSKKGGAAKGAAAAAAPAKKAGGKVRRAPGTTLCGMNIRGTSASRCQGNPAFVPNAQTNKSEWKPWETSLTTKGYECDHAWELQATVQALEGANFCKAWNGIQSAWNTWNPSGNAKKNMEDEFFRSLKVYANEPKMLFYVGSAFNGQKRAFTANVLAGRTATSSADLKAYFSSSVRGIVDNAVAAIDKDAAAILERVAAMAQPSNFDWETSSAEDSEYVCKLDLAEAEYKGGKPVAALWTKMKAAI